MIVDQNGRRVSVGAVVAAMGYDLVAATPKERAALMLAGFCVGPIERPSLARLAQALSSDRKRKARRSRAGARQKEIMPHVARTEQPAASSTNRQLAHKAHTNVPARHHLTKKRTAPSSGNGSEDKQAAPAQATATIHTRRQRSDGESSA
jgi:hypothetical protein